MRIQKEHCRTYFLKVQEQNNRSADFLASTSNLQKITNDEGKPQMVIEATGGEPTRVLDVNDHAFGQIAQNVEIDTRTARRLQEKVPHEYDGVVNALFQKEPNNRMVRTFLDTDENIRNPFALSYLINLKPLINVNLLNASLPQLMESDAQWQVVNGTVTDKRLYIRLKSEVQTGEAAVGDLMANGIGLSNSEVGAGSVQVLSIVFGHWLVLMGCKLKTAIVPVILLAQGIARIMVYCQGKQKTRTIMPLN